MQYVWTSAEQMIYLLSKSTSLCKCKWMTHIILYLKPHPFAFWSNTNILLDALKLKKMSRGQFQSPTPKSSKKEKDEKNRFLFWRRRRATGRKSLVNPDVKSNNIKLGKIWKKSRKLNCSLRNQYVIRLPFKNPLDVTLINIAQPLERMHTVKGKIIKVQLDLGQTQSCFWNYFCCFSFP